MKERMYNLHEYKKENKNLTISINKGNLDTTHSLLDESDIEKKTVVLFIDSENFKVFVIEIRKINSLIGQEEVASDLKVPFDPHNVDYYFDNEFFDLHMNRPTALPIATANNNQEYSRKYPTAIPTQPQERGLYTSSVQY
jgi:hypothetical protein